MTLTGVFRDENTPLQCRRQFPNYEHHRRQWKDTLRAKLLQENKRLVKLRFLADGCVADWEEIVPEQPEISTLHEQPESSFRIHQRHAFPSAIGRSQSIPVDLTFWNDEEDVKPNVKAETEPDSIPRPRDLLSIPGLDGPSPHRTTPPQNLALTHYPRSEGLTGPPLGAPTGPRGRRLNPDAPRVARGALTAQREFQYGPYAEHRYLRRDYPGSLQLVRVPAPLHPPRGSRARLRGRHEERSWAERRGRDGGAYEDDVRRSLMRQGQASTKIAVESPGVPQDALASERIQIHNTETSQVNLAGGDLLTSFVSAIDEDAVLLPLENEILPNEDQEMLAEEPIREENYLSDADTIPPQDGMHIDSDMLPGERDSSPSDSSEGEDSLETDDPPLHSRPLLIPDAQRLLASINFAIVEDALKTPTPNSHPNSTPTVNIPMPSKRSAERRQFSGKKYYDSSRENVKSSTNKPARGSGNVKGPPRLSMQYLQAETVKLPKPEYARARRLLAPTNKPLVYVSMPGDIQFVRDDERTRVEQWSLPAPARNRNEGKNLAYVVTDACLLGESNVVMVHETGPHPASLICVPDDEDGLPVRHNLSHGLVPTSSVQRRGILASVCALNSRQFFTGGVDKRVMLWNVRDVDDDDGLPSIISRHNSLSVAAEVLDVAHAASVRALAYSGPRNWLVSAAGAKVAITDVLTGQGVVRAGKQKWASNDVFNVHFHKKDPNILLVETGDLDKQARIYDLRKIQREDVAPERLIGSTETGAISQFTRGDWAKSLIVRPSSQNMVKVWDTRQPDKPLSVHTLSHTVTHCIFIDDCRTIGAIGDHFVTFLDARA